MLPTSRAVDGQTGSQLSLSGDVATLRLPLASFGVFGAWIFVGQLLRWLKLFKIAPNVAGVEKSA